MISDEALTKCMDHPFWASALEVEAMARELMAARRVVEAGDVVCADYPDTNGYHMGKLDGALTKYHEAAK